mgnify:CR=1 FL=1
MWNVTYIVVTEADNKVLADYLWWWWWFWIIFDCYRQRKSEMFEFDDQNYFCLLFWPKITSQCHIVVQTQMWNTSSFVCPLKIYGYFGQFSTGKIDKFRPNTNVICHVVRCPQEIFLAPYRSKIDISTTISLQPRSNRLHLASTWLTIEFSSNNIRIILPLW